MGAVPEAYAQLGMAQMLEQHSMTHGTGINRWQPFGTFALESNQQAFLPPARNLAAPAISYWHSTPWAENGFTATLTWLCPRAWG
ncbi:hypothetical protein [Yersinia pseudotuberculosis]|uniref:hypothetical protein n=1 Tax=Yersinia pseudotuberculosis TaxID=633 RepID=UPI0040384C5F